MSRNSWNRRTFLKAMGLGGAGSALLLSGCGNTDIINEVDLEVRKEKVEPNVDPQDFVQPGVALYYASTCRMCPAGCNLHSRIREARVLKLEGNPSSPVNHGRLCPMGQAGLHAHYNPDRLTKPMMRKGGKLVEVSWDEAMDTLKTKLAKKNGKLAWLNGAVSGHHAALIQAYLNEAGSKNMFVFDTLPPAVGHAVNEAMFGYAMPKLDFKKAKVILSFGADFLGTWMSPVQFATQYAEFRQPPRGTMVMVESKMTLTGANADRWVAIRPGTEGHLAMGLAAMLIVVFGGDTHALIPLYAVGVFISFTLSQAGMVRHWLTDGGAWGRWRLGGHGLGALVPTQVFDLVHAGRAAPASVRAIVVGGGALGSDLYTRARELGWPLLPSYGATECASQIATASLASLAADAFPELEILSHAEVRTDAEGRIAVRSPALLTGYATAGGLQAPKRDGWWRSEDRGAVDSGWSRRRATDWPRAAIAW